MDKTFKNAVLDAVIEAVPIQLAYEACTTSSTSIKIMMALRGICGKGISWLASRRIEVVRLGVRRLMNYSQNRS